MTEEEDQGPPMVDPQATGVVKSFVLQRTIPANSKVSILIERKDGSEVAIFDYNAYLIVDEPKYTL